MARKRYKSVIIPEILYNKVKDLVESSEGRYVSISKIVRKAVWKLLNEEKASRI